MSLVSECERKWGFKYLDHIPEPVKLGANLGTEVQDEQVDPYLRDGRPFDFSKVPSGEIAQGMVLLLPPAGSARPGGPIEIRRKFQVGTGEGFVFIGELDIWGKDSAIVPGLVGGAALIGDVKTTKNLRYARTEEALRTDIQANLYAAAMLGLEDVDVFDLVWITGRTVKPHRAQRAVLRVGAPHILEQYQTRLLPLGKKVAALWDGRPKAADLPPNPKMCDAYGGCPYRHICNLSPAVFSDAVNDFEKERTSKMGNAFLDNLRSSSKLPDGVPTALPFPVRPAPAETYGLTPAELKICADTQCPPLAYAQRKAELDAAKAAAKAAAFAVPEPSGLPAWATAAVDPRHAATAKAAPAINPPEAALPPAPPINAAATGGGEAPAKKSPGRPKKEATEQGKTMAEALAPPALDAVAEVLNTYVPMMRAHGVKRLVLSGGPVMDLELFTP